MSDQTADEPFVGDDVPADVEPAPEPAPDVEPASSPSGDLSVGDQVQSLDGRVGVVLAVHQGADQRVGPDGQPLDDDLPPPVQIGWYQTDGAWLDASLVTAYDAPTGREEGES